MTVYIDEFAVLNVISDWAVLALTGKMCGMEVKPFKIAQALAIGLIYGVMALLLPVFSAEKTAKDNAITKHRNILIFFM